MSNLKTIVDDNVNEVINEIRLALKSDSKKDIAFILLEGDNDTKIYSKFFIMENVLFRSTGGRGNMINAMRILTTITTQVIAIRDADFAHLRGTQPEFDTLFFTDKHDIEMTMLVPQGVLENVFAEFGMQDKAAELLKTALSELEYVSYIRWIDANLKYKLDFNFGIASLVKDGKNKQELLHILNSRSKQKSREITEADVENFIENNRTSDYYNLCNGHDVLSFLALHIGSETSQKEFPKLIRSSFQWRHFSQTKLYDALKVWQITHGFNILKMGEGA